MSQIMEAKYAAGAAQYKSLTNEKIVSMFMVRDEEMSDDGENNHFYTRQEIHISDKGNDESEVKWLVVHPKGSTDGEGDPSTEAIYYAIDFDTDRDWETDPQKWQVSHLQVLFDG